MKNIFISALCFAALLSLQACNSNTVADPQPIVDNTAPGAPTGLYAYSLNQSAELYWNPNTEFDLAGYYVYRSSSYDGQYTRIGQTNVNTANSNIFLHTGIPNGATVFYAVAAFDAAGNEGDLSIAEATATPRPEGFNVQIFDIGSGSLQNAFDFQTATRADYLSPTAGADVYLVRKIFGAATIPFLKVYRFDMNGNPDTDIQDMGYTNTFDDIFQAPNNTGWSEIGEAEAIVGHTYVFLLNDNCYAKLRIRSIAANNITFDWAYQTQTGNTALRSGARPKMPESGLPGGVAVRGKSAPSSKK